MKCFLFYKVVLNLEDNDLSGIVPESICVLSSTLVVFEVDSSGMFPKVNCSCCPDSILPYPLSIYIDDIQSVTTNISTFNDVTSPQYKALSWINSTLQNSTNISEDDLPNSHTIQQSYILAVLFYTTNGANWTNYKNGTSNWLTHISEESDVDVCLWDGILCSHNSTIDARRHLQSENSSYVSSITLKSNNLHGSLPSELSGLTKIRYLSLQKNHITGTIPDSFGNLTNITDMYMGDNFLSGNIPSTFMNLRNLERIDLSANSLSGEFPTAMTSLSSLRGLWLDDNSFHSNIPEEIGNMASIRNIRLDNNNFSGTIPSTIAQLTSLQSLYLNRNSLNGTIPASLGNLTNLGKFYCMR